MIILKKNERKRKRTKDELLLTGSTSSMESATSFDLSVFIKILHTFENDGLLGKMKIFFWQPFVLKSVMQQPAGHISKLIVGLCSVSGRRFIVRFDSRTRTVFAVRCVIIGL